MEIFISDVPTGLLQNLKKTNKLDLVLSKLATEYGVTVKVTPIPSKERTLELARNYKCTNFGNDYPNEYHHAIKNKYLPELRSILKPSGYSKERTLELARNYKGTSFKKDYRPEYNHAVRNRYLPELNAILILNKPSGYSKERTLELARNYKGTSFRKDYPHEYDHAIRNNYLPELNTILKPLCYSKERTLELARNYKGTYFGKDYPNEYQHAIKNKYLSELNTILKQKHLGRSKEKTKEKTEKTLELARNYKGTSFKKDYPSEYNHAAKYRYLPELRTILNKNIERT